MLLTLEFLFCSVMERVIYLGPNSGNVDILIGSDSNGKQGFIMATSGSGNPSHATVNVPTGTYVNHAMNSSIVPVDMNDVVNICVVTDVANEPVNTTINVMNEPVNEFVIHATIAVDLVANSVNIVDSFLTENEIREVVAIEGVASDREVVISEFDDEWHQNSEIESDTGSDSDFTCVGELETLDGNDSDQLSYHEEMYDVVDRVILMKRGMRFTLIEA